MSTLNRIKIEICGSRYTISSPESETYVRDLASQLDAQIREILAANESISINDALILAALGYLDAFRKLETGVDHMRSQLTEYLEDAARARIEVDESKREIARLNQLLKLRQSGVQ